MKGHRHLTSVLILSAAMAFGLLLKPGRAHVEEPPRLAGKATAFSLQGHTQDRSFIDLNSVRESMGEANAVLSHQGRPTLNQPIALASADFDEDGVQDLVIADGEADAGRLVLYRGNADSIYPYSPAAQQRKAEGTFTNAPFFPDPRVCEMAQPPEFIAAGDFDNDGHQDVLAASRSDNALYLLKGDGQGGIYLDRRVELAGRVTAMIAAEVNRADGLADLILALHTPAGPKLLVYAGPGGALGRAPEEFDLPAEATALVTGRLDEDSLYDLAAGAGSHLILVRGRDRNLSMDESRRAEGADAEVDDRPIGSPIKSMAVGHFTDGESVDELAVLTEGGAVQILSRRWTAGERQHINWRSWQSRAVETSRRPGASQLVVARVSSLATDNLIALDPEADHLDLLMELQPDRNTSGTVATGIRPANAAEATGGGAVAVLPMRLNDDALSDLVVIRKNQARLTVVVPQAATTYSVTNTADSGTGSLRDAILKANANPGADTIVFNSAAFNSSPINLSAVLPTITEAVAIDGTTQPGFAGTPIVEINGNGLSAGLIVNASNTVIRGLVINRFAGTGIQINGARDCKIEGNFIGTNRNGMAASPNGAGIVIDGGRQNLIGGTAAAARNLISGNSNAGIIIARENSMQNSTGNQVQGNLIGTDSTGAAALANQDDGVRINLSSGDVIGGTAAGSRNVISGNTGVGLRIGSAEGCQVQGNIIGAAASGVSILRNTGGGIGIRGTGGFRVSGITIGGTAAAARNLISGNDEFGIQIFGATATDNRVQGNFIGTNLGGTAVLGNAGPGVWVDGSPRNLIGGDVLEAQNIISGNLIGIIIIGATATNNRVQRNLIGTRQGLDAALGNISHGIYIDAPSNFIGGASGSEGNVISANGLSGVRIAANGDDTQVQGNIIGAASSTRSNLGNSLRGVHITGAANNLIGGTTAGATNLISGNSSSGVWIEGASATNNRVQGNLIGVGLTPGEALGNRDGVSITNAPANLIGGTAARAGNVISGNDEEGVTITGLTAINNMVQGNFIGTNVAGTAALRNGGQGVLVQGTQNLIGGAEAGARNIISGNQRAGVEIQAGFNSVQGNLIGTDVTGTAPLGNESGVFINGLNNSIDGNTVGGTSAAARNVISGNLADGVVVRSDFGDVLNNRVQGNFIGTTAAGNAPLGNRGSGVVIDNVQSSVIGGVNAGAGNVIAFNGGNGIAVRRGVNHDLRSNSIFSNGGLGIDLGNDGVTANDEAARDADAGPNNLQNFPLLTSVSATGVQGRLVSRPNTTFTIQIFSSPSCDPSGNGEGQTTLASGQVTTDVNGLVASFVVNVSLPAGAAITATVTDSQGNTSEFSPCLTVPGPRILQLVKSGKQLIVIGEGFSNGAKVLLNGVEQKTIFESSTRVVGKKAGKKARPGDQVQVRNPDGTVTAPSTWSI